MSILFLNHKDEAIAFFGWFTEYCQCLWAQPDSSGGSGHKDARCRKVFQVYVDGFVTVTTITKTVLQEWIPGSTGEL